VPYTLHWRPNLFDFLHANGCAGRLVQDPVESAAAKNVGTGFSNYVNGGGDFKFAQTAQESNPKAN